MSSLTESSWNGSQCEVDWLAGLRAGAAWCLSSRMLCASLLQRWVETLSNHNQWHSKSFWKLLWKNKIKAASWSKKVGFDSRHVMYFPACVRKCIHKHSWCVGWGGAWLKLVWIPDSVLFPVLFRYYGKICTRLPSFSFLISWQKDSFSNRFLWRKIK